MIRLTSQQLLQVFPQTVSITDKYSFQSVVIDSRKTTEGCLFVAIKGDRFDGHQFVKKAAEMGAVAAIVEKRLDDVLIPQILVKNTRLALAELANFWRKKVNPLVIAITGSNGKTTVKEMLGQILSAENKILMTAGNFNNEIGVPLTLFQLSEHDRFAVIEMGANHQFEIKQLMAIAEPDVIYVNNARAAHIEGFGSLEKIIQSKGEMYQFCNDDALAIFNEDEDASDFWKSITSTRNHLNFSSRHVSDVSANSQSVESGLHITLSYQQHQYDCLLSVYGEHNAQNAVAAITIAIGSGLSIQQACLNLQGFSGVKGRQQFVSGINNSLIINDTYNANPDSLAAAVKVLCSLDGIAWLALGDMAEMGESSLQLHQQAARDARRAGVQQFFAFGDLSCQAAETFAENGFCFNHHDEMAEFIASRLDKSINLLVKGSRSAGMEKVVERLILNHEYSPTAGVKNAI